MISFIEIFHSSFFFSSLWLLIYYGCRYFSINHYTKLFLILYSIREYRKTVNNSFCLRFLLMLFFKYEEINSPFSVLLLIEMFVQFSVRNVVFHLHCILPANVCRLILLVFLTNLDFSESTQIILSKAIDQD